jgi:hypothetical protein
MPQITQTAMQRRAALDGRRHQRRYCVRLAEDGFDVAVTDIRSEESDW